VRRRVGGRVVQVRTSPYGFLYLDIHWRGRRTKRSLKLRDTPAHRRLAERKAAALEERLLAGDLSTLERKPATPPRLTVGAWGEVWLTKYIGRKKSGTRAKYAETLRLRWLPRIERVPLVDLTREQLTTHLAALEIAGLKYKTVCLALDVLRACLNAAVQDGHLAANPAARLMKFLTPTRATRAVDAHRLFAEPELRALLQTAEREFPELYPIILIMARTGLRVGEALLLQPGDFDFEHRRILVQRTWGRSGETTEERFHQPPKGGAAWVDASDQVCAIVQRLLTIRQAAALVDRRAPSEWLFPRERAVAMSASERRLRHGSAVPTRAHERTWDRGDLPLEPPAFYHSWPRLVARAGLARPAGSGLAERTPHSLRHTFASLHIAKALQASQDRDAILTYLRSQMRHRSIQTTMDYYIHLFPGGQREITNRLDDDSGQAWVPVVRYSGNRRPEPSGSVPKPSRSPETSRLRGINK
jgi:integrase